jgi:FkbM family methyltransferase
MLIDFRKLFPKYGIKPKGVLHVGANVGEEAPVYDELNCGHVSWIEANPDLIPQLSENVNQYGHCIFNFCVSDVDDEEITFHISNNAGQSSSMLDLGTHKTAHPEVHYVKDIKMKTKRIDSFFSDLPIMKMPDFLNIDLQGAELKALKGMGDLLKNFKWAYLEVNKAELYKGCALVEEIDNYLLGFGFKRVETMWCGNTGWGDALYVKGR